MAGFTDSERLTIYGQLRSYESDFDKAQSQMRTIASAWSAAMLAAIALITINSVTPFVVPKDGILVPAAALFARDAALLYLRQIICMVASIGVFAFWFIDQNVYQRLLHSVFAYGLHLELKNADLPQTRSAMLISNSDITGWLSWFYRVQFWAFLVLSLLFLAMADSRGYISFAIAGVHFVFAIIGEVMARCWPSLDEIVGRLYRDLRAAWPDSNNCNAPATVAWIRRISTNPAKPKDHPTVAATDA